MAYVTREAQQDLLEAVAEAVDELGVALAVAGAAYEQLDDASADRLEQALFRPLQLAYGRAQRTHAGFASRYDLPGRTFVPAASGAPSQGVRELLERTAEAAGEADAILAELQDSLRPVEIGDAELRAGLAEVRELLAELPARADGLVRTFGR